MEHLNEQGHSAAPLSEPKKDRVVAALSAEGSALRKYQTFFIGAPGLGRLLTYELAMHFAAGVRGALGYALRKVLFSKIFGQVGAGCNFGRNLALRCPMHMTLGARVMIDDNCSLDARGTAGTAPFEIGDDTLIARDCVLLVKQGYLKIGRNCSIGSHTMLGAASGIEIGDHAIIAGQCYFGGGRYKTKLGAGPMVTQGLYSRGPVVLGEDVWVGAGVRVLDGVRVGNGAILGAGSVVTRDVPDNAIVGGCPATVLGMRT